MKTGEQVACVLSRTWFDGHAIVGASLLITSTVNEQNEEKPFAVAV